MGSMTVEFPVINLSEERLVPGTSHWAETRDRVRKAMEEYGAFVAEYDKLSLDQHEALWKAMRELYAVPEDLKALNQSPKPSHGHLTMEADGYRIHEGLGIDNVTEDEACRKFTRLMWPEGNDQFYDVAQFYTKLLSGIHRKVMKMLLESYGMEEGQLESHVASTRYLLRFLSYRKQRNGEANVSFKNHTDKSFMTIIHQNHVKGLQMRTPAGEWIPFEPSPTRFVVLAGDGLMVWSNDRIQSFNHKVVMDEEDTRLSIGFFTFLTHVTEIPKEFVDEDHPLKYKPFNHDDLLRHYTTLERHKRSLNEVTKRYCAIDAN